MPLVLGLVPEDRRAAVLDGLAAQIRAADNRVTAGDIGFNYLVRRSPMVGKATCSMTC